MAYTIKSTNASNKEFENWKQDSDLLEDLRVMIEFLGKTPRENDQTHVKHLKTKGVHCRYEYRRLKNSKRVFYEVDEKASCVILRHAAQHLNDNAPYPDLTKEVLQKELPPYLRTIT